MATAKTTRTASWWERLTERCYATSTAQLVRDVQHEAGPTYHALLEECRGFCPNARAFDSLAAG